jgi:exodeoxyribonuclease V gamma subunit
MPAQLYFSNTIEALIQALADEISIPCDPFDPVTVIVPNQHLQKWIQLKIAGIHGISMNVMFHFLNDGMKKMMDDCNPDEEKPSTLEQKDIQLLLYHAISGIEPGNAQAKIITEYLYSDGVTRKDDYDHKIWQLSSRISRYFMEYELYREDMIQSWMNGTDLLNTDMESAQRFLYQSLFKKNGYRDSINKKWLTLPQYCNGSIFQTPVNHVPKFILIGESHLTPFHAKLIFEMGKYLSISVYQLNPCSEFWEDVTTPREDRWHRIRSIGIEQTQYGETLKYSDFENPLLKLWGKTGRETVKLLSLIEEAGSREQWCTSEWIMPEQHVSDSTMLSIIQGQILRRTTGSEGSARISQDTSIQVASCPELFREVESIYNSILYNLERDSTLDMTDIAVMVPDMSSYGPVINSVFSREPRRLTFNMIDSTAAVDSMFAKAVLSLLEIATGSFTRKEISALVRNPCFYEARAMSLDDALVWIAWADKLNIYREFSKTNDLDPEQNLFTWQQGLLRLRMGRIMDSRESSIHEGKFLTFNNIVPYTDINTGNQGLADTISSVIELLHYKTKKLPLLETSADEWIRLITGLITEFLIIPADRPEENLVYSNMIEGLNSLAILDHLPGVNRRSALSITAIKEFIAETLTGIPSSRGSYLTGGINISALVPKRQIPFRIIYILGMQEGMFPGSSDSSALNLMTAHRRIGDATRPDINRYHFLETLLSAREKFYITYISKDLQRDQDFHPNSVIGQLITYLNSYILNNDFIITEVPLSGSSLDYLRYDPARSAYSDFIHATINGDFIPVNYNESDRLVLLHKFSRTHVLHDTPAKSLSEKIKTKIPDFSLPVIPEGNRVKTESISLNDVRYYLFNPAESILRWHLSMYDVEVEDTTLKENEPFYSVFPYNYTFIINSLNYCLQSNTITDIQSFINRYYRYSKLMSNTPHGAYGDIDNRNLQSDILNRFHPPCSLLDFLQARKQYPVFHTVAFGATHVTTKPDQVFPAVTCPVILGEDTVVIELKGSLPVAWKNPDTGDCETMVITNSTKPSIHHLIYPFLWYVASASRYNEQLSNFIGPGPFTIHISHKKGISSYSYHLSESESRQYLNHLLINFMDAGQFDLLPLPIISDKKIIQPPDMRENPEDIEKIEYRQALINLIEDDAEKMNPAYRPMALLQLVDFEVPADAYCKVRDRLGILFKPFSGGATS